jgi:galactonate dehydratase
LAACIPNFKIQETFDDFTHPWISEAVRGAPLAKDGFFDLPQAPGLGIELNEEVIRQHPPREGFFNLWDSEWHKRDAHTKQHAGG